MTVQPVERTRPPQDADELTMLVQLLDFQRATVVNKVAGLSDEQAFGVHVPPSTLTPAGIVNHMINVERWWFSIDFADNGAAEPPPGANFDPKPGDTLAGLVAEYLAECERARKAVAGESLDELSRGKGVYFTLRYAYLHMIEEYARHNGHLDLLREVIDGQTGF